MLNQVTQPRWKIYRWNEQPNPFRGRNEAALKWVRELGQDRAAMTELRNLVGAANGRRLTDVQVFEEVAARLTSGEFQVCADTGPLGQLADSTVVPAEPAAATQTRAILDSLPPSPPKPKTDPPPKAPETPPAPPEKPKPLSSDSADSPTMGDKTDAEKTAETLKKASEDGTPFCEECQKAKEEQEARKQQSARPGQVLAHDSRSEPATMRPGTDAQRTAATLRQASQDGAPFCEECEKAKAQAAKDGGPGSAGADSAGGDKGADREAGTPGRTPMAAPDKALQKMKDDAPTLSGKADHAAIAKGLKGASASGSPYCEEHVRPS